MSVKKKTKFADILIRIGYKRERILQVLKYPQVIGFNFQIFAAKGIAFDTRFDDDYKIMVEQNILVDQRRGLADTDSSYRYTKPREKDRKNRYFDIGYKVGIFATDTLGGNCRIKPWRCDFTFSNGETATVSGGIGKTIPSVGPVGGPYGSVYENGGCYVPPAPSWGMPKILAPDNDEYEITANGEQVI